MIIVPRDIHGNATSEGQHVKDEIAAWQEADTLVLSDPNNIYVTLHDEHGKMVNELWRTEYYQGWVPVPEENKQ